MRTEEVDVELAQSADLGGDLGALDLLGELAGQLCERGFTTGRVASAERTWTASNTAVVAAPAQRGKRGARRGRYALEVKKM